MLIFSHYIAQVANARADGHKLGTDSVALLANEAKQSMTIVEGMTCIVNLDVTQSDGQVLSWFQLTL